MKKLIALLVVLVLCLSLCACSGKSDVKVALQGTWVANWTAMGQQISRYYSFKGDSYTTGGVAYLGELEPESGTYKIKGSTIELIPDDGSDGGELDYSYNKNSGTLNLWWNDDVQFERGKVNVNY